MFPCRPRGGREGFPRPRARGVLRGPAEYPRSCPPYRLSSMTMFRVRKAIFPAAGLGTRFLPVTKAQPKEMLPLVDKPTIQYGVEEAIASGIEQVIMVTGGGKRAIVDHFDRSVDLEHYLRERDRGDLLQILAEVDRLSEQVDITYIQQKAPRGLGDAVWTARRLVEGEPCAVLLADDVILCENNPVLKQLIDAHAKTGATVLAVRRVPRSQVSRYGIIATNGSHDGLHEVTDVVEKPSAEDAPSDLAALGRYVITPAVFDELSRGTPGAGKEIQLVDAIKRTIGRHHVVALEFEGDYYDTGTVPGYLRANLPPGWGGLAPIIDERSMSRIPERVNQLWLFQDEEDSTTTRLSVMRPRRRTSRSRFRAPSTSGASRFTSCRTGRSSFRTFFLRGGRPLRARRTSSGS